MSFIAESYAELPQTLPSGCAELMRAAQEGQASCAEVRCVPAARRAGATVAAAGVIRMQPTPARASVILWTVNLTSIAASVFSYVYLSYYTYTLTGSLLLSEAVLIAPMVMPVLMCLVINRVANASTPRGALMAANAAGLALALGTFLSVDQHVGIALAGTLAIGLVDAIQRVARTVAVKRYFSAADIRYAMPITLTAQFIAGAIAGMVLSFYKGDITPQVAGVITAGGFAIAACAAALLPRLKPVSAASTPALQAAGALATLQNLLRADDALRSHFLAFVIVVSVLQGFFNVSRVTLPLHVLQLPQSHVGYLQIIGATAALAAALAFALLGRLRAGIGFIGTLALTTICLLAMVGCTVAAKMPVSFSLFALYMFLWEILFFKYQADLVTVTPQEHMPLVATFQFASVYAGMLVTGFAGSFIAEVAGLTTTAVVFALLYALAMAWIAMGARTASRAQHNAPLQGERCESAPAPFGDDPWPARPHRLLRAAGADEGHRGPHTQPPRLWLAAATARRR
ncbi:hypothetical protein V4F39_08230 [Aquincola sp. MAHUQ-54]|uniref:MFS transporter n=1 Tax=Aquincola agrisoli TaxID=3119538 RepID=A0AAW9QCF2_9BURK